VSRAVSDAVTVDSASFLKYRATSLVDSSLFSLLSLSPVTFFVIEQLNTHRVEKQR
jgi:hypothetical protein